MSVVKNKFKVVYDRCQKLAPKVKRNQVIDEIKSVSCKQLRVLRTQLDTEILGGYFLSANNTDHPFVKTNGSDVIVIARGLNDCWELS